MILLVLVLIWSNSCGKKTDPVLQEPFQLAATYKKDPTPANADKFFDSALALLQGNLLSQESKLELLIKSQDLSKQAQNPSKIALFTSTLIKEDPQNQDFKTWCSDLVGALKEMQNVEAAQSLALAYASAFPGDEILAEFKKSGLNPPEKSIDERIEKLAATMFSDSTHQFNESIAASFIDACEALAMINPRHNKAVDYLFKAATTARSIQAFPKALSIYDWLINSFGHASNASQAAFFKAFTLDNDLHEIEKARAVYADFIKKYPADEFADDAQFLMDNLGKSDEDILKSLKKDQTQ